MEIDFNGEVIAKEASLIDPEVPITPAPLAYTVSVMQMWQTPRL